MEINLEPGKYVVAVSGGVDSVVLLDVLRKQKKFDLVVAHFDHGIRTESKKDCDFVAKLSSEYSLPFYSAQGNLGRDAGEASARKARYKFLDDIKKQEKAKSIITAHHQDDLVETMLINVIRGTGRKGISPLGSRNEVIRPLLGFSKNQIIKYANVNNLVWREDPSNWDQKYLRNYIRHNVIAGISDDQKKKLIELARSSSQSNQQIDILLDELICSGQIGWSWFRSLPNNVSSEILSHWLRRNRISFDKKLIQKLVVGIKTSSGASKVQINKTWNFKIAKNTISLRQNKSV